MSAQSEKARIVNRDLVQILDEIKDRLDRLEKQHADCGKPTHTRPDPKRTEKRG